MFAEFVAGGCCGADHRWLGILRRGALEIVLEDMFRGARLAGDFREAQEERLREASAVDAKDAYGLVFCAALENYGVEIGDATGKFGAET